ncbi:Histone-lysine N-methyltransferase, H3 lysine-4 specific [Wickerhamiella sorbophila]|uniref:Histone-lysine N-methyltransferase, H3 lysine-4 specific n=1 Tax=Wickerhamiella sorbophila TaxID=45607 RepID=A0A2T0FNF9_9ASCO|nr:Histone-lysine N-methyltransferase, H3 lysine-4 specific [Wickerhamiella sorbophila]PRT56528.1 Histone-lysine N-methyltransferase, H3 lysine-4 specific [Wickerhamiella sorbophila]
MDTRDFKCVYDPILASVKKGKIPVYVKIKPGGGRAVDPRLNQADPRPRGVRKVPQRPLPVPSLVIDKNWIGPKPPTYVLLYNMSTLTTVGQISSELQLLGKLDACELVVHPDTAMSLGMCRIRFAGDLGLANKLASSLVAGQRLRINGEYPSVAFDEDMSFQRKLVAKIVETKNKELEEVRRLEKERIQREQARKERERQSQLRELSAPPPNETYDQWLDRKVGYNEYLLVKTRLHNTEVAYRDLADALRDLYVKEIIYHPSQGFHVTFISPGKARRCLEFAHKSRLRRIKKPLYLEYRRRERTDPVVEASKQILAELESRLVEDIRRRVVLKSIMGSLVPSKYQHLERRTPSPAVPRVEHAALSNGLTPAEDTAPLVTQTSIDFKKLHFKKRNIGERTTPIKRRKLTIEELESDEDIASDTGADDESLSDPHEIFEGKKIEVISSDVDMEDAVQPERETAAPPIETKSNTVFGKRPTAKMSLPDRPLQFSDLQSFIKDDEDWQYLEAALGTKHAEFLEENYQKALVWASIHYRKEETFQNQHKPVGEIPQDMLVPEWKAPAPTAWRLRGYAPIPSTIKSSYLPHRRRLKDPIDSVQRDSPHDTAVTKSTDRHSRMASRRLAQDLNSQKQALSVETSILDMNQLLKRRKPVKFARSAIHNWGLYAVDKIERNEMIIEYVGEVIRAPLADLRERNYVRSGIGSSYLFRIDDQTVIDATKRGGIARFINHSCDPSCMAKVIKVEGTKRIVIYAMRDVQANEELTYDYKFEREEGVDRIVCLCGAANCKGYLN